MKQEFTGPRSDKGWDTPVYRTELPGGPTPSCSQGTFMMRPTVLRAVTPCILAHTCVTSHRAVSVARHVRLSAYRARRRMGGAEEWIYLFLPSALDAGWSSHPLRRRVVAPSDDVKVLKKRVMFVTCRVRTPVRLILYHGNGKLWRNCCLQRRVLPVLQLGVCQQWMISWNVNWLSVWQCMLSAGARMATGYRPSLMWNTVGSRFATVRLTTIHFYDTCPVEPSTADLWCVTVATQASFPYLVRF